MVSRLSSGCFLDILSMCPEHSLKTFPCELLCLIGFFFLFHSVFPALFMHASFFPLHPLPLHPFFSLHLRRTGYVSSHLFHLSFHLILDSSTPLNVFENSFLRLWHCQLHVWPKSKKVKGPYYTLFWYLFCFQTALYNVCAVLGTQNILHNKCDAYFCNCWFI